MGLSEFLEEWGYVAVLIGTFFEGETILVLGGIAAHMGHLSLPYVMLMAFIGSLFGDQLWFFVGRFGGRWVMRRRRNWRPAMRKVLERVERNQVWFILIFRFLYGLRTVAPFAIGMSRVKTSTYVILNVIGAAVWAVAVALLGYVFGQAVETFMGRGKKYMLLALGLALAIGLVMWWMRRRRMAAALRQEAAEKAELARQALLAAESSPSPAAQVVAADEDDEATPMTSIPLQNPRTHE